MNGELNEDRAGDERTVNERMRELGRRSGEARRRRRDEPELTDHEQAKAALRRALDGGNKAAMVSAAKALLEFDKSDPRDRVMSVEDARTELDRRLDQIEEHRRLAGQVCTAYGGIGYVQHAPRPEEAREMMGEGV